MTALPIIVGMGGVNAAGRTSFHQGFRRIVIDKLNAEARQETFVGLATLMNLLTSQDGQLIDAEGNVVEKSAVEQRFGPEILAGTFIKKALTRSQVDIDFRDTGLKQYQESAFETVFAFFEGSMYLQ